MSNETVTVYPFFREGTLDGAVTNISGTFGVNVTKVDNTFIVSIDQTVFSGTGGFSVSVIDNKIVVSGSSTDITTQTQAFPDVFCVNQTTDASTTSSTFSTMGSLSGSISTRGRTALEFNFTSLFSLSAATARFRITVDGTPVSGSTIAKYSFGVNNYEEASITCVSDVLLSGSHTIAVEWATSAATLRCTAGSESGDFSAWFIAQEVVVV